jgi:hypothetical protein
MKGVEFVKKFVREELKLTSSHGMAYGETD